MSDYTCPKCGEAVGMMGHGSSPCLGKLSSKATELGRLRVLAHQSQASCPFCHGGRWQATGTAGRLACGNCRAIALDGRSEAVKIEVFDVFDQEGP